MPIGWDGLDVGWIIDHTAYLPCTLLIGPDRVE